MIASKLALTISTFRPITSPSSFIMSASIPMIVWPSEARNSLGAYCASVATTSLPFDLIAAGTCAAIVALALLDVVVVVVAVELVPLLLLPQPASTRTVSAGIPKRATSLLIGSSSIELTDDPPQARRRSIGSAPARRQLSCQPAQELAVPARPRCASSSWI